MPVAPPGYTCKRSWRTVYLMPGVSRLETITKLNHLIQTGKCQQRELQSLCRHVERLEACTTMESLVPEISMDLQSIADVSGQAVERVLCTIVLEGLQSPRMTERWETIPEAHARTFDWIFDDKRWESYRMRDVRTYDSFTDSASFTNKTRRRVALSTGYRAVKASFTYQASLGLGNRP